MKMSQPPWEDELFKDAQPKRPQFPYKEKPMLKNTASKLKDKNVAAAKQAAKLEVGTAANKILANKIHKHLPMMVRGYSDHPIFPVVMANLFAGLIEQFAPENAKVTLVSNAMLDAAMLGFIQSFNISELIEDLTSKVNISKLTPDTSTEGPFTDE